MVNIPVVLDCKAVKVPSDKIYWSNPADPVILPYPPLHEALVWIAVKVPAAVVSIVISPNEVIQPEFGSLSARYKS